MVFSKKILALLSPHLTGPSMAPHRLRRDQAVLSQGPSQEVRLSQLDEVPPLGASEINGKAEVFSTGYQRSPTLKLDIYIYGIDIYIYGIDIYICRIYIWYTYIYMV